MKLQSAIEDPHEGSDLVPVSGKDLGGNDAEKLPKSTGFQPISYGR